MKRMRVIAALLVAAAATATGVGVASSEPDSRKAVTLAGSPAAATDVIRDAVQHFSVLQDKSAPSSVPAKVGEMATAMLPSEKFTTHEVAVRPGFSYYVLESANRLCDVQVMGTEGGNGGCYSNPASLAAGDVGPITSKVEGGFRITAFVPDGTSEPTLLWTDGQREALELSNNLVSTVVKELPTSINWRAPDGNAKSFAVASVMEAVK